MCLGLVGTATSVAANEIEQKLGRGQYIPYVMIIPIGLAFGIGFSKDRSYGLAAVLRWVYAGLIWADSSSLIAGTVGSAEPERWGAIMAVHWMFGYFGGFLGPLALGATLYLAGVCQPQAWDVAFMYIGVVILVDLIAFRFAKPRDLVGDRTPR